MTEAINISPIVANSLNLKIKSISFNNYKIFNNNTFNFSENNVIKNFICFIGSNGIGKSTTLNAIQLLFTNFEGIEKERIRNFLSKCISHNEDYRNEIYHDNNFLLSADIQCSLGDYTVSIDRNGFVKDHPSEIKELATKLCYLSKFDMELNKFQLMRSKWPMFKEFFEAITGFTIEEPKEVFSSSFMEKYVFDFLVYKNKQTISHKECSDGEKKIIKSFTTMLNLEYTPQIILIDNIEMHVEPLRHLNLIKCMKKCYPDSQLITTTHSYHISRNFAEKSQIYDLRLIGATEIIQKNPYRLYLIDLVKDGIMRLNGMSIFSNEEKIKWQEKGEKIIELCNTNEDIFSIGEKVKDFTCTIEKNFVDQLIINK